MINGNLEMEAKEKLQYFVKDTYGLIKHLVDEGYDANGRPFFFEDLSVEIRAAWEEFEKDFSIENTTKKIRETPAKELQVSGLYGSQLKLKLSVVEKWMKRFSRKRFKRTLLKLLDAIDTVLDSLIAVTGTDQALKEIKDILRSSID